MATRCVAEEGVDAALIVSVRVNAISQILQHGIHPQKAIEALQDQKLSGCKGAIPLY